MSKAKVLLITAQVFVMSLFFNGKAYAPIHVEQPEQNQTSPDIKWTKLHSKFYALTQAASRYGWSRSEQRALIKLWQKESNWRSEAYNHKAVNGKHAGGIPQILGLDPATPPSVQIDRGLRYIKERYGKPSIAWSFHRKHNWY